MLDNYLIHLFLFLLLLIVALVAGVRLVRLMGRIHRRISGKTPSKRDLLLATLQEQAKRERTALAKSEQDALALEQLDALYRTVMTHLPVGVLVIQPEGTLDYANPCFLGWWDLGEVVGRPLAEISPQLLQQFQRHQARDELINELEFVTGHQTRHMYITLDFLPDGRHLMTLTDKTREHHLEETIRYKRDLELMGELVGGITHEVKNSIAAIQGRIQMLAYGDKEEQVAKMMAEIQRLLGLIQKLGRGNRDLELKLKPLFLGDLIEKVDTYWQDHPAGRRVAITKPLYPKTMIMADCEQVESVLRNLILNGLEACEGFADDTRPWVSLHVEKKVDRISLIVEDRGPGFSEEAARRLFMPFVTSKAKGSGLGLFHSRKILMAHGARIEVGTEPPTRITCHFPVHDPGKELDPPADLFLG